MNAPLLWGIFFLCLSSCALDTDYIYIGGRAQGTTFNISYLHPDKKDLTKSIDSLLTVIDKSLSTYDSASIISKVNRNEVVEVDQHFVYVFDAAKKVYEETNGAFDITIGPLMRAYQFDSKSHDIIAPESLDSIMALVGMEKVVRIGNLIKKQHPNVVLDVNAIAQGYTVDVLAEFLENLGIENYMVEVGGEVRAKGVNEKNKVWTIGIEDPVNSTVQNRVVKQKVLVQDESICTSGNYRKYFLIDGKKYGHSINPKTGLPAQNSLVSATVMHSSAMYADAFATAILVMGLEKAKSLLEKHSDLKSYLLYYNQAGELEIYSTL